MKYLIESLRDVIESMQEEQAARKEYTEGGGYEWGYAGFRLQEKVQAAQEAFYRELNAVIDERVDAKLKEMA